MPNLLRTNAYGAYRVNQRYYGVQGILVNIQDRLALLPLVIVVVLFPIVALITLRIPPVRLRVPLFALSNVAGTICLSVAATAQDVTPK